MAYFYIDFENLHYRGLLGIDELPKSDKVYIYCREPDKSHILSFFNDKPFNIRAKYEFRLITELTKNALDFVLISDLASEYRNGNVCFVISKDKGFDAAIHNLQKKNIFTDRSISIAERSYHFILDIK